MIPSRLYCRGPLKIRCSSGGRIRKAEERLESELVRHIALAKRAAPLSTSTAQKQLALFTSLRENAESAKP